MHYTEYLARIRGTGVTNSELPFPLDEYQGRLSRIRTELDARGVDCIILSDAASVYYVSGHYTFGNSGHTALIIPREGKLAIQVHAVEASNHLLKGWVDDVLVYNPADGRYQLRDQLVALLRARGLQNKRIGIEAAMPGLRIRHLWDLQEALPNARFIDASDLTQKIRLRKSTREIACHRKAAELTSLGMKLGLGSITLGKTENEIAGKAYDAMVAAGSEFMSVQPIVVAGYRNSFNHVHFYNKRIEKDEIVFLEFGACHHRYTSPIIRNACVGTPTDTMRRFDEAVMDCLCRVIESLRPGRTGHDVAVDATRTIQELQKEAYHFGVYGYSVGAQFPPSWIEQSAFIVEGSETTLEPGMVFHLPIVFRAPQKFAIGRSETILIGEHSCEVLTAVPRDLHIVSA